MGATVATRVSRGAAGRRRRAAAVLAAVVTVAAGVYVVSRLGDAAGGGGTGLAPAVGSRPTSELLVLQVVGTDDPLLALVGSRIGERAPSFFTVPFDLSLTVPGQGDIAATEVAASRSRGGARRRLEHVRCVGGARGRPRSRRARRRGRSRRRPPGTGARLLRDRCGQHRPRVRAAERRAGGGPARRAGRGRRGAMGGGRAGAPAATRPDPRGGSRRIGRPRRRPTRAARSAGRRRRPVPHHLRRGQRHGPAATGSGPRRRASASA